MTTPRIPDKELEQVVRCLWKLIKDDQQKKPPVGPPKNLKAFIHFTNSKQITGRIRKIFEEDPAMRQKYVDRLTEKQTGEIGWLWLTRPDGWEETSTELIAEAQANRKTTKRIKEARHLLDNLRKKLAKSEKSATRIETTYKAAIKRERKARKAWKQSVIDRGKFAENRRIAEIKEQEAIDTSNILEREFKSANEARIAAKLDSQKAQSDVKSLSKQIKDLEEPQKPIKPSQVKAPIPIKQVVVPTRRVPVTLPTGLNRLHARTAKLLSQHQGMCFLVDGYNVAFKQWTSSEIDDGTLTLSDLRTRLERRLRRLANSHRLKMIVVWDGHKEKRLNENTGSGKYKSGITVYFSLPGVTADDLLVDICENMPVTQAITVVTSDKELQARSKQLGCNVLDSNAFWSLLPRAT